MKFRIVSIILKLLLLVLVFLGNNYVDSYQKIQMKNLNKAKTKTVTIKDNRNMLEMLEFSEFDENSSIDAKDDGKGLNQNKLSSK